MQILVTLSFGIICLSLVFTTIASANALPSTKSFGKLSEKQHKAITVILSGITKLEVLIGDILDVYK
jgi:hypothetical protein